jgi:hypothetical protein
MGQKHFIGNVHLDDDVLILKKNLHALSFRVFLLLFFWRKSNETKQLDDRPYQADLAEKSCQE